MHCKHAKNLLFDHADGGLDPAIAEAVDAHLLGCADCASALANIRAMEELASGWRDLDAPATALTPTPMQPVAASRALSQWLPLAASIVLGAVVLFQNVMPTADNSAIEDRLSARLVDTLDQRLAQLEQNQRLLLHDSLDALDTEQAVEQRVLARAVFDASQQQNRNDLQALLRLMDQRLSRQEELTRQGFAVLLTQQLQDRQRLDELDDTLNSAVTRISARRGNEL